MNHPIFAPTDPRRPLAALAALAAVLVTTVGAPPPGAADDRDLFRSEASAPYIFVLFDSTGSMADNLLSRDTALEDDDPSSKLFLAKQALYEVLEDVEGVNFGFATFPDQDRHYVDFKSFNPTAYVTDRNGSSRTENCSGWEPNDDRSQDLSEGYTYKWSNATNGRGLEVGDLVPLDWGDNNVERIQQRLAPNLALGESTPDFGIARYFRDSDSPGSDYRALRDDRARPFIARGLTPLAGALNSFRDWYGDWRRLAEDRDPAFALGCRQVFVLLMTDGFETCDGDGPDAARKLLGDGVETYVVGFAVNNAALDNIAAAGGTEKAFFASDQAQLIAVFNEILVDVQTRSRTFASAAVPSVVGAASDSLYLTSFGPVADSSSLWPGRVDAWVKPVRTREVDGQQVPDRDRRCTDPDERGCLAWDAGEKILTQAPDQGQVDAGNFRLGLAPNQRRVYWTRTPVNDQVPLAREYLLPPSDYAAQVDLYGPLGMGISLPADPTDPIQRALFAGAGNDVLKETLKIKTATVADPLDPGSLETRQFVLGDIFHSDPTVLREPRRSDYFALDLAGQLEPCAGTLDLARYPCFVKKHLFRRRVLFAGSNDGQLHAFDAGLPRRDTKTGLVEYDFGSGGELFAYLPRQVLRDVREMADGEGQDFTVDGPVSIDDVLVDPITDAMDAPRDDEREWRTVLIGGLREGGSAYYALDVTQPDPVLADEVDFDGNVEAVGLPDHKGSFVPGCADGGPGCGPLPYPAVRWTLTDVWDEDNNGASDLADTWSRVNTGRIRVRVGSETEDRYVAIFGGGLDPDFEQQPLDEFGRYRPASGNYLYMVDIETGKIIYKRRIDTFQGRPLCASLASRSCLEPGYAPSEPAAVDTDRDSYLDTIYIGTSAGYLMKVDISAVAQLESVTVDDWAAVDPLTGVPPRRRDVERVIDSRWQPFPLFSTGGRPIFYPPSVVFVADTAQFALAFGTGDRFDITRQDPEEGRFYVFLDTGIGPADPNLPYSQSALTVVDREPKATPDPSTNFFSQDPGAGNLRGWLMELEPNERLLNRSFALAGLLTFSTFIPEELRGGAGSCASTGISRLYAVFLTNGSPLHGTKAVLEEVNDFVTQPFVSSTDAADDMGSERFDEQGGNGGEFGCRDEVAQSVRDAIMRFFPDQCTFSNFSLDVEVMLSQNGIQCVVPIPVCVIERNWKEW